MPFIGADWRSPGDKWIRTEFGWKRLSEIRITLNTQIVQQLRNLSFGGSSSSASSSRSSSRCSKSSSRQLSRKASPVRDGEVRVKKPSSNETACCSYSNSKEREKRLKHLNHMLAQRCTIVSARTSSRESNHYSTISDAINKLNFHQALYDENCFPFICKVVTLLFESYYLTLSGSLQMSLLRITDTATGRVIETRKHSGLVLKMIDKAIATLEIGRQKQFTAFGVHNIDSKIKPLLKLKRHLQAVLLESTSLPYQRGVVSHPSLSTLPSDCLRQIISHLSHPRDILSLGQTCPRLHSVTEENWVWRELTHHHYREVDFADVDSKEQSPDQQWKQVFSQQYKLSKGQLRGEMSHAVSLCKTCNFVFWKSYGHPCCNEANSAAIEDTEAGVDAAAQTTQGLTAEQFLHLFVS